MQIRVYTGVSLKGNPGPAGLGIVLKTDKHQKEKSTFMEKATVQEADLSAIALGLAAILEPGKHSISVYTTSQYAKQVLAGAWKAKKNLELIDFINEQSECFKKIDIQWVDKSKCSKGNDLADSLAKQAVNSKD